MYIMLSANIYGIRTKKNKHRTPSRRENHNTHNAYILCIMHGRTVQKCILNRMKMKTNWSSTYMKHYLNTASKSDI